MQPEPVIFPDAQVASVCCMRWQKLLLLADWEVQVKIVRQQEISGNNMALVSYNTSKKLAVILLLDPVDYFDRDWPLDHEKSLVHELLHLHLAYTDHFLKENDPNDVSQEVAVDSLARAFVRLARGSMAV